MYSKVLIALVYIESAWNPLALSHANAKGLGQMTPIAVREVVDHCKYSPVPDLYHWETNLDYSACYLNYCMLRNKNRVDFALMCYNGGQRQVNRYKRGKLLASETLDYVYKVTRRIKNEEITVSLVRPYQRSEYSLRLPNLKGRPHQINKNKRANKQPRKRTRKLIKDDVFKSTDYNPNRLPRW